MSESEYVIVHTATGHIEAKLVQGLLEAEGIRALVPGSELVDEFAMGQRLVGTVEVVVLRDDLERARDVVEAWKEAPPAAAEDED